MLALLISAATIAAWQDPPPPRRPADPQRAPASDTSFAAPIAPTTGAVIAPAASGASAVAAPLGGQAFRGTSREDAGNEESALQSNLQAGQAAPEERPRADGGANRRPPR